jgi:hypothetical protein
MNHRTKASITTGPMPKGADGDIETTCQMTSQYFVFSAEWINILIREIITRGIRLFLARREIIINI